MPAYACLCEYSAFSRRLDHDQSASLVVWVLGQCDAVEEPRDYKGQDDQSDQLSPKCGLLLFDLLHLSVSSSIVLHLCEVVVKVVVVLITWISN